MKTESTAILAGGATILLALLAILFTLLPIPLPPASFPGVYISYYMDKHSVCFVKIQKGGDEESAKNQTDYRFYDVYPIDCSVPRFDTDTRPQPDQDLPGIPHDSLGIPHPGSTLPDPDVPPKSKV